MDPQIPASFIPKKPLGPSFHTESRSKVFGLFLFVAVIIFIGSLAAAGAAYLYKNTLQTQNTQSAAALEKAKASYDPTTINDLIRTSQRITQASILLKKHTAPSSIFDFLANTTVQGARFSDFSYLTNQDGTASIALSGEAVDFASVALLSDAFNQSHMLNNLLFSNVDTDQTTGHVVFKISANVSPALISYSNMLANSTSAASVAPTQ